MNTVVLIKQVPDTETKIRLTADNSGIDKSDIKWIINPYDEFAIEEALKIKEKTSGTVTVIAAGPDRVVEALRTALAMGADNAVHVKTDEAFTDSVCVARALAEACKKEGAGLVFTGKQAIDDDQCAVFGYVGEFLNWPSSSVVVSFALSDDKSKATVEREVEGGTKLIIETPLPAVIAVNKGINTPRYASLPGIMKAKKKEIKTYSLGDLASDVGSDLNEGNYMLPPERKAGKKIEGDPAQQAAELVRLLREEAKVL